MKNNDIGRPSSSFPSVRAQTVGEIVRLLRSRLDLDQVEIALACGWRDASAVSRIETDRIHPTRRTLLKLADNLSRPAITGTPAEIRGWLFLAAGILPTAREVDEISDRTPDIENLLHPAWVRDIGWYLWRSNALFTTGIGLPARHIGRNYLEMFFEDGGSVRRHLGDLWNSLAPGLVAYFRKDTARYRERRWFVKLVATLRTLPDFEEFWNNAETPSESVFGWSHTSLDGGMVGTVHSHLTADPRLIIRQILPEDPDGRIQMFKYGALPRTSELALL